MMKPTINDASEDTYHPTFHIEPLHEYKDYDSDEDMAYETAFGTTICAGDYMQQYKEHNRAHSNLNSMLVPSPSALKSPARSNNTMITHTNTEESHLQINPNHPQLNISTVAHIHRSGHARPTTMTAEQIPSPTHIHRGTSAKSMSTINEIVQSLKNDTTSHHDSNEVHHTQVSERDINANNVTVAVSTNIANIAKAPNSESKSKFKIFSFLNIPGHFESSQLEYGQSALYDKTNGQYFADLESDDKRYVLINLQYVFVYITLYISYDQRI